MENVLFVERYEGSRSVLREPKDANSVGIRAANGGKVELQVRGNRVLLRSDDRLTLLPEVTNSVEIIVEPKHPSHNPIEGSLDEAEDARKARTALDCLHQIANDIGDNKNLKLRADRDDTAGRIRELVSVILGAV